MSAPANCDGNLITCRFDASLVPLCADNVTAALILCYFEQCFCEAGYPSSLSRRRLNDWYYPLGWNRPQPFFKSFYAIGVLHLGKHRFAAQVQAHREFLSERRQDYVFYAMEVQSWHKIAILHRNRALIDRKLNDLRGVTPMEQEAPVSAIEAARQLIGKLSDRENQQ